MLPTTTVQLCWPGPASYQVARAMIAKRRLGPLFGSDRVDWHRIASRITITNFFQRGWGSRFHKLYPSTKIHVRLVWQAADDLVSKHVSDTGKARSGEQLKQPQHCSPKMSEYSRELGAWNKYPPSAGNPTRSSGRGITIPYKEAWRIFPDYNRRTRNAAEFSYCCGGRGVVARNRNYEFSTR